MRAKTLLQTLPIAAAVIAAVFAIQSLSAPVEAAGDSSHKKCAHGIQACDASQVGQPCNPNNLNIICSAQSNGHYCCLAYAP